MVDGDSRTFWTSARLFIRIPAASCGSSAAKTCAETTRREAGNIDYTFYAGVDSPDTFFLFEQWESRKALDLHMKSEHLAAFRKVLGDLTAEPSVIRIFEASEMKK